MAVITNKPDMNFGIWAENGDIETPSSEKVSSGWDVEKPFKEQMNWVQNRQDRMLQYINQHGIPEWDSRTDYPKDSYTVRSGILYKSFSQNTDKDPSSNTDIWEVAFANQKSFNALSAEVGKIKTQDGYLGQYVQVNTPYMNATCRGVGYTGNNTSLGLFFDSIGNPELRGGGKYSFNGTSHNPDDVLRRSDLDAIIKDSLRYKVGDLYLTTVSTDPKLTLGYGTWERYAEGRALVGISTKQTDPDWTKGISVTSGNYQQEVTFPDSTWQSNYNELQQFTRGSLVMTTGFSEVREILESLAPVQFDKKQTINTVQPSITIFIWRRTS